MLLCLVIKILHSGDQSILYTVTEYWMAKRISVHLNIAHCISHTEYCVLHYNPCDLCNMHFKQ